MIPETDGLRTTAMKELTAPEALMGALPITIEAAQTVTASRAVIQDVLHGRDDRLVVVVGPCSIHDPDAALEYARRLVPVRAALSDRLELVMRCYFEKPRTTVGWKGLINDPGLDESFDINRGLRTARELLLEVNGLGVPVATEFLDTAVPQYITDLVAWAAIGARTTESQIHREMASGLSCPVGFKNGTSGDMKIAVDAVRSAAHPHHFMAVLKNGRAAIATTSGNPDAHVILRGGASPNYDAASVDSACQALEAAGVRGQVMVDASHANSGKKPENQPGVIADIAGQIAGGETRITGAMIESHLVAGRQDIANSPLIYGQSVTDGCVGWETTVEMLENLADAVEKRRPGIRLAG